ncbi:hypothetical protein JX266_014223 [Neoarthrinium moseri]|nr:hypothetical protein JX266_014223 [Neoarthrinium moseri]
MSDTTETAKKPLPIGLRLVPPPDVLPAGLDSVVLNESLLSKLEKYVQPLEDEPDQGILKNEDGVIEATLPYFLYPVKYVAPIVLRNLGFKGKLEFLPQVAKDDSRPDRIVTYDGEVILALDYKAPNCIAEEELLSACVKTVQEAKEKLQQMGPARRRGRQVRDDQDMTLLLTNSCSKRMARLVQSAVKYAQDTKAPTILFYDVDYLMALKPPEDLQTNVNVLMEVTMSYEAQKSTEKHPVHTADNHCSHFLSYIVAGVQGVEATREVLSR